VDRRSLALISTLCLALLAGCQQPSNPSSQPATRVATARIANANASSSSTTTTPVSSGHSDYYLLTLSWSPEYCDGHPNNQQCNGDHPGFIVHGLWPQFQNGQWPSQCSSAPGLSNPSAMLDIMPDRQLIAHEWSTHGTCSGLTASQYFGLIRKAYASIKIPPTLINPTHTTTQSATGIKQLFANVNPGMSTEDIAISCHNRYLSAVEFCLSKDLRPIACQAVRDCNQRSIRIPSAR
jgi:ribonuclease T2